MHWTIFALLSAVSAAAVAILGKIGLKGVDSTLATTIRAVVMSVFLVVVTLSLGKFNGISSIQSIGNKALIYIVLSGIAGALSWLFYFFALKFGPASGVSAIDRTSAMFVLILAVLFLGETLTWFKAIGAIFIVGGAILMIL